MVCPTETLCAWRHSLWFPLKNVVRCQPHEHRGQSKDFFRGRVTFSAVRCWYLEPKSGELIPGELAELLEWLANLESRRFFFGSALTLLPNPFQEPPEAVAQGGVGMMKDYFTNLFEEGFITKRRNLKVVIVGKDGSGKTR